MRIKSKSIYNVTSQHIMIDTTGGEKMGDIKTITKIPVGAAALMGAAIYAVLGLIGGIIAAIGIGVGASLVPTSALAGVGGAAAAIIGGVVGGFIGGYIMIAIVALIYNWLAPRIGGVKLELE
jgi:hypothetical protein